MDSGCKKAIQEELRSPAENKTWGILVPPDNAEVIDNKWVFREKEVNDVMKVKKKARLVAHVNYLQRKMYMRRRLS